MLRTCFREIPFPEDVEPTEFLSLSSAGFSSPFDLSRCRRESARALRERLCLGELVLVEDNHVINQC